ncbi:MAG: putative peptidoglycan glycosyltransferase FtsW [Deltaproteobacteria bacterium]|jgi:cell division protein FtsW|nr:putative peptidoglycan glycosyltransferase FtsW [Deltaproteobacteria bacterium]
MSARYDLPLIGATLFLLSWGTVMIYSTGGVFAELQYNDGHYFLYRHLIHVLAGLAAMGVALTVDYKKWKQLSIWLMAGMLVLLILVLIPEIGHEVKGGRRWLRYGSLSIQPAELLKVVLIIYVASYLERKQELLASFFRGLTPNFIVTSIFLFLVLLQPDFGNVILMATTVLLMLYVGGGRPVHIASSLIGVGIIAGLLIASHTYRVQRMLAFLNPWDDPQNSGFQIIQSFIALGTGGWVGRGLGESLQKRLFLPDAHTDFIFAIIGEELGFLWIFVLIILFSVFIWRGYWIAWNVRDTFGKHLSFGATTILSLQIILNLFVVVGLLPTKGLPLPFISYGGTSLVVSMFLTGLLLNISARLRPVEETPEKGLATATKPPPNV